MNHRAQRQGDEFFCARCGKRWDVKEKAPDCAALGEGLPVVTNEHGEPLWQARSV